MGDKAQTASPPSLRAQRSNPESLRGKILDCFAALAMTECGRQHPFLSCPGRAATPLGVAAQSRDPGCDEIADAWAPALQRTAKVALRCVRGTRPLFIDRHSCSSSRHVSPELCFVASRPMKEGAGKAGSRLAPIGRHAKRGLRYDAQRETGQPEHPGLPCAMVGTAYVALSPGSDALLPPSPYGWLMRGSG
ncbi:hypothetical protein SAMN04487925_11626 [Bradyrhizobium sp. cf659]|nr:hypothetical protein SAMN04487925_11626 [Bradyrhizobium sp. cf659]